MRKRYLRVVGLLIFLIIIYKVNILNIFEILSKIKINYLFVAISLTIPQLLIKTWRWKYILQLQKINYSLKKAFIVYLASTYIGIITPGRIGDFIKVFYLKEDQTLSGGRAFSSVLVDKFLDLMTLLIFAILGIAVFSLSKNVAIPIFIFLFFFISALIILLNKMINRNIIKFINKVAIIRKYKEKIELHFEDFLRGMKDLRSIKILIPILSSLGAYLVFFLQCYLIAMSLSITITFFYLAFCVSIANIISFIPISIAGIGTRDATLIVLFSTIGLSKESAISYSLLFLFVIFISTGIMGSFAWFRRPLPIKFK